MRITFLKYSSRIVSKQMTQVLRVWLNLEVLLQPALHVRNVDRAQSSEGEDGLSSVGSARKAEAEELRVSDTSGAVLGERTVSRAHTCEGGDGLSFVNSSLGSQKKRKALLREESADTQEHESCQLTDIGVRLDEMR